MSRLGAAFLFLAFYSTGIFAQDISGEWSGTITQNSGGFSESYGFSMKINVSGKVVTGSSVAWFLDKKDTKVEMTLTGEYKEGNLSFKEDKITYQSDIGMWEWCLKAMTLKLEEKADTWELTGKWWGTGLTSDCPPGKTFLSRPAPPKVEVVVKDTIVEPPHVEVKVDTPKVEVKHVVVDSPKVVVKQNPPIDTVAKIQKVVPDRRVVVQKTIETPVKEMKIFVWDSDEVDGDRVTLYFNGEEILKDYRLTKEKKEVTLKIMEGSENTLVLFAVDEGKKPLNTAAISWWDKGNFVTHILHSDMNQSGAMKFGK